MGHLGVMSCRHHWQSLYSECPYGTRLPGDVTWADWRKAEADGLISKDQDPGQMIFAICVFYSYLPYLVVLWGTLVLLMRRGTRELSFCALILCTYIFSDVIVKRILSEPRPERSCLDSCGMPSSHSAISMGLFTLVWIDVLLRAYPSLGRSAERCLHVSQVRLFYAENFTMWRHGDVDEMFSWRLVVGKLVNWTVILLPVPFSRIVLRDHTPKQVLVGSCLGISVVVVWMCIGFLAMHRCNHRLGESLRVGGYTVVEHNLPLPFYMAFSEWRLKWVSRNSEPKYRAGEASWYLDASRKYQDMLKDDSSSAWREYFLSRDEKLHQHLPT